MRKTILLVEDSPDEIVLARRAFAKAQLDVELRVAESGSDACSLLAQDGASSELPQLVLLDLQMKDGDGLAVLRALRAQSHTRTLPVVIFTSSDEPGDIAAAYACGANSYVRKPVNFEHFVSLVQDIHQYWLRHNRLPAATESRP